VKQADPEIGFERMDLVADRGRGHVEFVSGPAEAVQPRRRLEGPQRAQRRKVSLHCPPSD
jgi:hypothetical protein